MAARIHRLPIEAREPPPSFTEAARKRNVLPLGSAAREEGPPDIGMRLLAERGRRLYLLDPQQVGFVESEGNYVAYHVGNERYVRRGTLVALERQLAPLGFVRVSRRTLVNLLMVQFVERYGERQFSFTLRGGAQIHSGTTYRKAIADLLYEPVLTPVRSS